MSDLRERIARAIEAEADRYHPDADAGYLESRGRSEGLREAAGIARDTPAAHDEPATPARTPDVYRTLAARLWAERHGVANLDIAYTVIDELAVSPRP